MTNDIATLLESARKARDAAKQKADADFLKATADLLSDVKVQLADALAAALKVYEQIPQDARKGIFSDAAFAQVLGSLGLKEGKRKKSEKESKPATPRVKDEVILAYLDTEKKTADVEKHFDLSSVTVGKRLKDLLKAKKVAVRKEGTSKFWKKV